MVLSKSPKLLVVLAGLLVFFWQLGGYSEMGDAQSDGLIKMGFVRVEDVFVKFEGTNQAIETFRQERRSAENELANLNERREAGTIGNSEFLVREAELIAQLSALDSKLTAEITSQIVSAARQVGERFGFDLVTRLNNVVVHAQSRVVSDVTAPVLAVMNANFEGVPFDFSSISVDPQPLAQFGFFSAEEVFVNYNGTQPQLDTLRDDFNAIEARRRQLNTDLDNGLISQAEFDARSAGLNSEQADLEQAFIDDVSNQIIQAVGRFGDGVGFDLISSRTNVVLHHNPRSVSELTESVLAFMNAEFGNRSFSFDTVSLSAAAPREVGFVNADRVFLEFEGTDNAVTQFRVKIAAATAELDQLGQDVEAGLVDPVAALNRTAELQAELNALDAQLTSEITTIIVETAQALGADAGFDLITPLANVVLYHNPDLISDVTDQVLERMNSRNQ